LEKYSAQVVEVCENGDAILQFSEEMIQDLDWKVDDVLSISMVDGALHLKNITQHPNSIKD
jgi:hypothetical protein